MLIDAGSLDSLPLDGAPSTSVSGSFSISPNAGHTAGARTITVQYSGGAVCPASMPITIQSGPGSVSSWVQDVAGANGSGHFTYTQAGVSGTPTVFLDSVTSTTQSYSNAAVAPSAPTIGTLTDNNNGTISITFTAPADNGGAAITSYTATTSSGGFNNSGASSPITISGINKGVSQTVSVTATNSAGTGSSSGNSNAVTPVTVPGVPTSLVATAGNAQASITFSAPADNGGSAITGYTLTSSPAGGTDSNAGSTSLTHVVTGLTNGTPYTFTATATNSFGTSSASSASNSVTPQSTVNVLLLAPYLTTDTIGTKTYQLYDVSGGALVTVGGAVTTGFTAIPNITNGWSVKVSANPNGSYGDIALIAVFTNINSTQAATRRVNRGATTSPAILTKMDLADFSSSDVMGSTVAQTLTLSATTGSGVTATAGGGTPFTVPVVGKFITAGTGRALVTARTSNTVVTVTVIDAFASTSISSSGWAIGQVGYQIYDIDGVAVGGHATNGIYAVPGCLNQFVAKITFTPDTRYGAMNRVDWDVV